MLGYDSRYVYTILSVLSTNEYQQLPQDNLFMKLLELGEDQNLSSIKYYYLVFHELIFPMLRLFPILMIEHGKR